MKKMIFLLLTVAFVSIQACKPKDADIKTAVDTAISSVSGVTASVNEGVVTLSGTVASEDVKATAETAAKGVKGVKSVTNSINVVVPVISGDVVLNEALKSVMTAFPGITAVAKDSVIILTGDVKRADLQKVMQAAQALKPKKVENMLTIK